MTTLSKAILALGLVSPILFFSSQLNQRPPRQAIRQPLFRGIDYQRLITTTPRPNILHVVTVDLSVPGIQPLVSMPTSAGAGTGEKTAIGTGVERIKDTSTQPNKISIKAQTVSEFVQHSGVQLGINGNYFYEFREKTPWDFYPHSGDPVYVVGDAIGEGDRYGSPRDQWPALCFSTPAKQSSSDVPADALTGHYRAQVAPDGHCPAHTDYAMAGRDLLMQNGQSLTDFPNVDNDKAYSRAAVGIAETGQTLWLVIVDGKQPHYSEGLLLHELADVFEALGVEEAIALDGGGSSTLVVNPGSGPQIINTPMHVKWPRRERPTANHLGFYASPLQHP